MFDGLVKEMNASAAVHFVKLLNSDNARTRWRAAVWLARRGNVSCADALAALMNDHDAVPLREAALVLPNLGIPPASNCELEALNEAVLAGGGSIRVAAAWALGLIGDSRALEVLLPLVKEGHDVGSMLPAVERCLTRDPHNATDADLYLAQTLTPPYQFRDYGDDSQFGPGPGRIDIGFLDLSRIHELAQAERSRRTA